MLTWQVVIKETLVSQAATPLSLAPIIIYHFNIYIKKIVHRLLVQTHSNEKNKEKLNNTFEYYLFESH